MNRLVFCLLLLLASSGVFAIGLGDLNRQPVLGERLELEINITGAGKEALNASCYRLKQPSSGDDIPWVKSAAISLRKGSQPVLEIRSGQIVHDPILVAAVHVACGQEIVREYMLLASPAREVSLPRTTSESKISLPQMPSALPLASARTVTPRRASRSETEKFPASKSVSRNAPVTRDAIPGGGVADRLMLSSGGEAGEPSLRFDSELLSINERIAQVNETQREMLRLEFRMLQALQEQALTQLEASEKLRNADKALADMQQNAAAQSKNEEVPAPVTPPSTMPQTLAVAEEPSLMDEWELYASLLFLFTAVAAWLGWRNIQARRLREVPSSDYVPLEPVANGDISALEEVAPAAVPVVQEDTVGPDEMMHIDLPLDDADQTAVVVSLSEPPVAPASEGAAVVAAPVDDRFEASPVMELADIMLSFGRVKGAAQALQEYIDANPQEALQPWMRLFEVYRMAGMRKEFEELALNLNKNFNVEIQHWDKTIASSGTDNSIDFVLDETPADAFLPPRAECIEDMPRIMQQLVDRWQDDDFAAFIYELLRDNRGGTRLGFSLGVVEEMLFLVELKETIAHMDKE